MFAAGSRAVELFRLLRQFAAQYSAMNFCYITVSHSQEAPCAIHPLLADSGCTRFSWLFLRPSWQSFPPLPRSLTKL